MCMTEALFPVAGTHHWRYMHSDRAAAAVDLYAQYKWLFIKKGHAGKNAQ